MKARKALKVVVVVLAVSLAVAAVDYLFKRKRKGGDTQT
jgi:preprotein translocase subunit SecE